MGSSRTITTEIDVDLDDFDEDDIIEYLEDLGYEVISKQSKPKQNTFYTYPSSGIEGMEASIDTVKDILQRRSYDPQFFRIMLTEITDMPLGSSMDKVCEKLQSMCM